VRVFNKLKDNIRMLAWFVLPISSLIGIAYCFHVLSGRSRSTFDWKFAMWISIVLVIAQLTVYIIAKAKNKST
jgi:hypothetical protein